MKNANGLWGLLQAVLWSFVLNANYTNKKRDRTFRRIYSNGSSSQVELGTNVYPYLFRNSWSDLYAYQSCIVGLRRNAELYTPWDFWHKYQGWTTV